MSKKPAAPAYLACLQQNRKGVYIPEDPALQNRRMRRRLKALERIEGKAAVINAPQG